MKMAKKVKAIVCTQCGSSLDLFGGHNVDTIVCPACNTCLDGKDEYKAVAQFMTLMKKMPNLPLKIGMKGTLKEVEWTVIGYIRYREDGEKYYDFQLFSPTHGYAWLTRNEYNYIFSRDVKDMPDIIGNPLDKLYTGVKFTARDMQFNVIEKGYEEIDFVAGELTWQGKVGDGTGYVTGAKPPYLYTISEERNEMSFSFGEYIDTELVYKAFGINEAAPKAQTVQKGGSKSSSLMLGIPIILAFVVAIILIVASFVLSGKKIFSESYKCKELVEGKITKKFKVNGDNKLLLLDLKTNFSDAWGFFTLKIVKGETEYFTFNKEIAYYSGGYGEDRWSEGSRSEDVYIRLPEKGEYQIVIEGEGGHGISSKGFRNENLTVSIYNNVILSRYFIIAAILLGFILFILFFSYIKDNIEFDN